MLLLMASTLQLRHKSAPESISVSILDRFEKLPEPASQAPKAPAHTPRPPAKLAKKNPGNDLPWTQTKAPAPLNRPPAKPEAEENIEKSATPPPAKPPPAREVVPEQTIIAERPLPSLRELLPPANFSSRSSSPGPVSLNTRDPVYVSYFTKIKQLIEAHWEYPELALRYGLQGKLSLEFTIGSHGQLERARIVRSSGSQLLDEEALRAIKAAAPFPPIPSWIQANPLSIMAAMEYHDNRVNYQLVR